MQNIGIMQGRLIAPKGRGIQFFPFEEWKDEFFLAEKLGIDEIEWIFDYYDYEKNPLWTAEGNDRILDLIQETGVIVRTVCWDYFMRHPFYKYQGEERKKICAENKLMVKMALEGMKKIGAHLIEIPMVDNSSVKNMQEKEDALEFISWVCQYAGEYGIIVGLETDFAPKVFRAFLEQIPHDNIVANYDSGNSSGLGYNHEEELLSLGKYVYNVHIKDRIKGGTTVALGTGDADFDSVFRTLKSIGYHNSYILQAARGEEGNEKENIVSQIKFVKEYLAKYEIS